MPLADTLLFINGKQVKPAELPIIPLDGFALSVFETMKSCKGKIIYLKEHLDRLFESAKTAGIQISKSRKQIEKELEKIISCHPERSEGSQSTDPSASPQDDSYVLRMAASEKFIFTIVTSRNYSQKIYEEGVDLQTSTARRSHLNSVSPEVKSSELMNWILAFLDSKNAVIARSASDEAIHRPEIASAQPAKAPRNDVFDFLYLGMDGCVREAGVWNFFMIKDGVLRTPPAAGILNGVIRRFVLKYALDFGILADEVFFTRHDVFNADEAFLTNSVGEIVPVRSLDCRRIGSEMPGAITKKLMKKIQQDEN